MGPGALSGAAVASDGARLTAELGGRPPRTLPARGPASDERRWAIAAVAAEESVTAEVRTRVADPA
jgi:hypothetical protein